MTPDNHCPRIAITAGEPAGVGPDIVITACKEGFPAELVIIASADLIRNRARQLQQDVKTIPFNPAQSPRPHVPGQINIIDIELPAECSPGKPDLRNAGYVLRTLETACRGCLDGRFDAMVTAPVHKGIINDAGFPFTGHTEYLGEICGTGLPVMMLADRSLRVALLTTHLPLSRVCQAVNPDRLENVIRIIHADLQRYFGLPEPRILVCGLNPHAGEEGHLGHEERDMIIPVLEKLRGEGLPLVGPVPADTAFTPDRLEQQDVVLAMYHDQGLPVLKARGFGEIVNITLGLPLIRTSVDHGTAFELAGSGKARCTSLITAIHTAITLASVGKKTQ